MTFRTQRVPPVSAQKHAHMQLVFLSLQQREEPVDSRKFSLSLGDQQPLIFLKIEPRDVERDCLSLGKSFQLGLERSIFGFSPGLDGAFSQGCPLVRDHQIEIKVDRIPESRAALARAKRIVE